MAVSTRRRRAPQIVSHRPRVAEALASLAVLRKMSAAHDHPASLIQLIIVNNLQFW